VADTRVTRTLLTCFAGATLVAVYAPTVAWLWGRWTISVWHNAHGALIPPAVAYLSYLELNGKNRVQPASSAWGFAIIVPALLLHVLDTGMNTGLLSAASLVLLLPGLSLLLWGVERTRAILFPLAFMVFALPIPLSLTESLHLVLRHVATKATAIVVPLLGIPVYAENTTLNLANASLTVGDACSGFSTLYAAAAMACLVAYQAEGWRRKFAVLVCAAPLAVAANIVRVIMLVVIVSATGVDVLNTWIHPASGMLTFAMALPLIFWLGQSRQTAPASQQLPAATPEGSL